MKNFFAFIGVLVVLLIGVGIWQGWFKFAVNSDEKVTVEMEGKKAKEDLHKAGEVLKDKIDDLKKKEGETAPTDKSTPTPTSGRKLVDTPGPLFGGR